MKSLSLAVMLLACLSTYAQSSNTLSGARAQAMGYTSSCLSDAWALFNNIGGLAKTEHTTAAFTYDVMPAMPSFNRMAALVAVPTKIGVAGAGAFRFGDDVYSEQIITAGFSNTFGIASLGAKVNYIQYRAEGFGSRGVFSISFGGIATITKQLSIGAHIMNLLQPEISLTDDERTPTRLAAGIAFTPHTNLILTTEIEKDLEYDASWKAGLEYVVHKKFLFRTGFNLQPTMGTIGFGFRPAKFQLDYSFQYQPDLGIRHQATVVYLFKSKAA